MKYRIHEVVVVKTGATIRLMADKPAPVMGVSVEDGTPSLGGFFDYAVDDPTWWLDHIGELVQVEVVVMEWPKDGTFTK